MNVIRVIAIGGHAKMTKTYLKNIIREELETLLKEVAKSKSQKRFMFAVKRCKEDGVCPSKEIKKAADSMSDKAIGDYVKGKSSKLPEKVSEDVE